VPRYGNYTGYGSDDGYDAIKDANAMGGFSHDDEYGYSDAIRRGWLRKKTAEEMSAELRGELEMDAEEGISD